MGFLKKIWSGIIEKARAEIIANRKKRADDYIIRQGLVSEEEQKEMDEAFTNLFYKKHKNK